MKRNFGYILSIISITGLCLFFFQKSEKTNSFGYGTKILESSSPITIQAQVVNEKELKTSVSQTASKQGYQVMVMTVENPTPYQYELKQKWVDLEHADKKKILRAKKLSSLPRSIFFKIASLFFWPVAAVDTLHTAVTLQRHHKFKDQLHASLLKKEGEIVLPYSMIQRYLVIEKESAPKKFKMQLLNCRTQKQENYQIEIT
jgi:hypothetical protein